MANNPNLEQVAKLSGVSSMTVSRVINNKGNVSATTRDKVMKAIQQLNYEPNVIARSLARKSTNIIGLAIYGEEESHPNFFHEIIMGVKNGAAKLGYDLMIFSHHQDQDYGKRIVRSGLVDAVILMGSKINIHDVNYLHTEGFPYVLIGRRDIPDSNPYFVAPDYFSGTKKAAEYLIQLGHKQISFIGAAQNFEPDYDKFLGYKTALEENQIVFNSQLVSERGYSPRDGYDAMMELLTHRPTAVIVNNTNCTLGAVMAIRESGLRIPEDISIIGIDDNQELNQQFSNLVGLEIDTLKLPKLEMGTIATRLAVTVLEAKQVEKENFLDLEFSIRNSCRKLI